MDATVDRVKSRSGGARTKAALWWLLPLAVMLGFGGVAWSRIRQVRLDAELIRAIKARNTPNVEASLRRGANPTTVDIRELKLDSMGAYWQLVLGRSAKDDAALSAIQIAYKQKYWDGVEVLVRYGESPAHVRMSKGSVLLLDAARSGATACCLTLIRHGVDPNVRDESGFTALMEAAGACRDQTILALLAAGADPRIRAKFGRTVLTSAGGCETDTVRSLLDRGADVNAEDPYNTPLSAAAACDAPETVRLLIERGAKVNLRPRMGPSPLAAAARSQDDRLVSMLLKAGAVANEKSEMVPLKEAFWDTQQTNCKVLELLLQGGADPDVRGESDATPLTLAIGSAQPHAVAILLKHGASLTQTDGEQMTPLDRVYDALGDCNTPDRHKKLGAILKMLQASGAKRASQIQPGARAKE